MVLTVIAQLEPLITRDETDGDARRTPINRLGPPAAEDAVRAVEQRLGHRLPEDFREFLLTFDGWQHFRYDTHLASTADLLAGAGELAALVHDYALDGDHLPTRGLIITRGGGRRFMVYEPSTWELVSYDLCPGRRFRTFTDWLSAERDELEQTLARAHL